MRMPTLKQLYNDYIVYYDWLVDYLENYDLKTLNGLLKQPIQEYVRENPVTTVVGTLTVRDLFIFLPAWLSCLSSDWNLSSVCFIIVNPHRFSAVS